ncbi:MAG: hypothetical protein NT062_17390 [Proteobacteria bacterium]|nr:hypothetical protein [Pseudomonadota bacterium]
MIATRLAAAAALLKLDVGPLITKLTAVADGLADVVAVTDVELRTYAVRVAAPTDAWTARRAANLAVAISGSKALSRAAIARTGALRVERGIGWDGPTGDGPAGDTATLAITGSATLAAELVAAAAIGVDPDVCAALGARLRHFGDEDRCERVVRATIFSGDPGQDARVELERSTTPPRLAEGLAAMGLLADELRLVTRVAARARTTTIRCVARRDRLDHVVVAIADPSPTTCREVATALAPPGRGDRWLAFAAALASDRVTTLEFVLGSDEPIAAYFGISVT